MKDKSSAYLPELELNRLSSNSLSNHILSYLGLGVCVVHQAGIDIKTGERFTVRFTGRNKAYTHTEVDNPSIIFFKPRIFVEGSEFAVPEKGTGWYNLPNQVLLPGESTNLFIVFKAIKNISGIGDWCAIEDLLKVRITADLDQNRLFEAWNYLDTHQEVRFV